MYSVMGWWVLSARNSDARAGERWKVEDNGDDGRREEAWTIVTSCCSKSGETCRGSSNKAPPMESGSTTSQGPGSAENFGNKIYRWFFRVQPWKWSNIHSISVDHGHGSSNGTLVSSSSGTKRHRSAERVHFFGKLGFSASWCLQKRHRACRAAKRQRQQPIRFAIGPSVEADKVASLCANAFGC